MSAKSSTNTQTGTNQTTQTGSNGQTNPWSAQVPYLTQAFQGAGNALSNSGQYTPDQLSLYSSMLGAYQNPLLQGTSTSSANAGASTSGAGVTGVNNAVAGLSDFNPFSTNNTAANIAGGNAMVAGSNIDAQTAAAMRDANIEANYVTNPGIDQGAAGSGNINSSRDAIAHGLVTTNLANTAADTAAGLTANAFNTGVNTTANTNAANNSIYAGSLASLLGGGANAVNAGTGANTGAINQQTGLYGISNAGASGQNTDPFQALMSAMGVFGGTGYGSTTSNTGTANTQGTSNSTQTFDPSQMSQIGAWTSLLGSLI